MIGKLKELQNTNFFVLEEWAKRGLNPSSLKRQHEMRTVMSQFISGLVKEIESGNVLDEDAVIKLIEIVSSGVYDDFDTEEREWCFMLFIEIASKLGLKEEEIIQYVG